MKNPAVDRYRGRCPARTAALLLLATAIGVVLGSGTPAVAAACTPVDVVVARGAGEPGPLGSTVGDPLYDALQHRVPVAVEAYAVDYPADLTVPSALSDGTRNMTDHLVAQAMICPDQRFVLVGYSLGAVVTHGVLGNGMVTALPGIYPLPADLASRIAAILLFGDPMRAVGSAVPAGYAGRTGNYCAAGDPVCGGGIDATAHSNYRWAMEPAADFAASQV
ncbi:cutinase family protein [Nocardia sp. NPDC057663]|uniref:cutinase family protein n=1 Tax=Nocardia sp. NPDC057663 TaxID=3346201 RepID=UPI00366BD5CF